MREEQRARGLKLLVLLIAAGATWALAANLLPLSDSASTRVAPLPLAAVAPTAAVALVGENRFENLPAPFGERRIMPPDENEPMPSETAAYCDEGNWSRMELLVGRSTDGAFRVDQDAWGRALTGYQVGLANWMSLCHQEGEPIKIVAAESGALLATYDTRAGLRSLQ